MVPSLNSDCRIRANTFWNYEWVSPVLVIFIKTKLLTSVQENITYGQKSSFFQKSISAFYNIWLISNDSDVTKTTCGHVGVKFQTDEYYGKGQTLFTGTEKCPKYWEWVCVHITNKAWYWEADRQANCEVYLNMVALHVACGIPKEPVHHKSLRIYTVNQGVRRLPTHKHAMLDSGIIFMHMTTYFTMRDFP